MAIVQSFWHGSISPIERLCLKSFLDHGHEPHVYSFEQLRGLPSGVISKDAASILPRSEYFTYKSGPGSGSPSAFANRFRYALLVAKGGWWIDMDVLCLSTKLPSGPLWFAREDNKNYNVAILRSDAGHPLFITCDKATNDSGQSIAWGVTGPRLFTKYVNSLGYQEFAAPASAAYAVRWQDACHFFEPARYFSIAEATRSSAFIHLWQEILRRSGRKKSLIPADGSFLRSVVYRHPVSGWETQSGRPISVAEIRLAAFINATLGISLWR
jgi:hypothetical protein